MIDGNDKHTNILERDDKRAILVDTIDGSFHTFEVATLETYASSLLSEEHLIVGKQCAPLIGVRYSHSLHKSFHTGSGNGDHVAQPRGDSGSERHILHVLTINVIHLQLRKLIHGGVNKDEVVDSRLQTGDNAAVASLIDQMHRHEALYILLVESSLDDKLAAIGDIHGVPMDDVARIGIGHASGLMTTEQRNECSHF